jgi:hypothetical protein
MMADQNKQIEEMVEKSANTERQKIREYCRRIREAVNYKGNEDHEDVTSILYDFKDEIAKGYRKERQGEWIDSHPNYPVYKYTCSLCKETKLGKQTPYCPNCGARMKGELYERNTI